MISPGESSVLQGFQVRSGIWSLQKYEKDILELEFNHVGALYKSCQNISSTGGMTKSVASVQTNLGSKIFLETFKICYVYFVCKENLNQKTRILH